MEKTANTFTPHPDGIPAPWLSYIVLFAVLVFLCTVTMILRVIERKTRSHFGWDDWMMMASYFFGLIFFSLFVAVTTVGHTGYQISTYTVPQLNLLLKIFYVGNMVYIVAVCLSKASVVFYYRRIFSIDKSFRIITISLIVGLAMLCVANVLALTFTDDPVQAQWEVDLPHTEINTRVLWIILPVLYIVFDLLILATPMAQIWKLRMTLGRKLLVTGLFVLGSLVAIVTLLRLIAVLHTDFSNFTYSSSGESLWGGMEIFLSIIFMNLPIVYSLCRDWRSHRHHKTASESSFQPKFSLATFGSKPVRPINSKDATCFDLELTGTDGMYEAHIQSGSSVGLNEPESGFAPLQTGAHSVYVKRTYDVK